MLARDLLPMEVRGTLHVGARTGKASTFDETTLARLRAMLQRRPAIVRRLFDRLGDPASRVAQRAFDLAVALGPVCGEALAVLLPMVLASTERVAPGSALELRRTDASLCAAIALVERLAPASIPTLALAAAERRGSVGAAPWWTFRAWQRLNEALQRQVQVGNEAALDLVLELVAAGAVARPGSPAHWCGRWAVQQLVPHMSGQV